MARIPTDGGINTGVPHKPPIDPMLDNENVTAETLLGFDYGGYTFSEEHTQSPLAPVFVR